jgi:XTP/dITP diphosphohydrolase
VPRGDRAFYWDTVFCPDGVGGKTYAEIVGADRSGLLAKLRISQSMCALTRFLD